MTWQSRGKKEFYDNLLVGNQIAEVIKILLEKSGYLVLPYGYESTQPGLCKKLDEKRVNQTRTILRIRYSPDLLVFDEKNRKLMLTEVKMRTAKTENQVLIGAHRMAMYQQFWDDSILVLVIPKGEIFYAQEIKNLEPKDDYDLAREFQKFEEIFVRVKEKDMMHFKRKAIQIISQNRSNNKMKSRTKQKGKTYSIMEIRKNYPNAYEQWSPEEDQRLIREFRAGLSSAEIVKLHQREEGAIHSRLKKLIFSF